MFPYAPPNINEQGYRLLTKNYSNYQIVNNYFKNFNVNELESFYRYRIRQISVSQSKFVNKISIV